MKELLADEFDSYMESFNEKDCTDSGLIQPRYQLKICKICPFHIERIPWIPNGFYYSENDKPAKHPYYLQDFIIYRSPVR